MNHWTKLSVNLANNKNYLDQLFAVYPLLQNSERELDQDIRDSLKVHFYKRDSKALIKELLTLELFPIKDSYVAYLKRDKTSIARNNKTVERLAEKLYDLGFDKMIENCTLPKETNRQIGPMFKEWVGKGSLGINITKSVGTFKKSKCDMILNASDAEMKIFAAEQFGYSRNKGIDFIARKNNKYVIGEAKFLTDFGGHQNAQFDDAISTLTSDYKSIDKCEVFPIAILDGVLYIEGNNKLHAHLKNNSDQLILSALLLNDYLGSL